MRADDVLKYLAAFVAEGDSCPRGEDGMTIHATPQQWPKHYGPSRGTRVLYTSKPVGGQKR